MDGDFAFLRDGGYAHCAKVWVRARVDGEPPQPLVSHTATLWRDRYLVVIGGGRHALAAGAEADEPPRGQWRMSNDVHLLDLEEMRWSRLCACGDPFLPRRGHCAVLLPRTDRILVFGGTDGDNPSGVESTRSDVCELDVEGARWRVDISTRMGCNPAPRRGHCGWASLDGSCLLVCGGFCSSGLAWSSVYDTALFSYEPAEERWSCLATRGEPPLLALAACALTPDRALVAIVGGAAVYPPFSDGLCFLDQRTLCWSHPQCAVPRQRVARRYSAAAAIAGSDLLLFGGTELNRTAGAHDSPDTHADLHALDISPQLARMHRLARQAARASGARAPGAEEVVSSADAPTGAPTDAPVRPAESAPRTEDAVGDARAYAPAADGARGHAVCSLTAWQHLVPDDAPSGAPSERNGMTIELIRGGSTLVVIGGGVFRESGGAYFSDVWLLHALREPTLPAPPSGGPLGDALGCLLDRPECADVTFLLDCGARCFGHAAVLGARSHYFRALLAGGFGEAERVARAQTAGASKELGSVRVRGVSAGAFRAALWFLYTGALPAAARGWSVLVPELLVAADMWTCDGLRAAVEARVCKLLREGEVGAADAVALADTCGCTRIATFAAELRALELIFRGTSMEGPSWPSLADAAEPPALDDACSFAQLVERRLRRKGVALGHVA
ncbi:hypothetical protein KFE25_007832 [Diacronema lutheri]|uniref:BTB domain-containing protein n=2 Tax=Diacronema lutheri TaxID=2081491 RepID=A0A8J6CE52_DIALT|nr:hypothetical protein KFE25_007832 [Diacronema lutheri]